MVDIPNSHVLIVEPSASGHHMALYVRHIVRLLKGSDWRVSLLTTAEAVEEPAFKLVKEEAPMSFDVHLIDIQRPKGSASLLGLFFQQLRNWRVVRREFSRLNNKLAPNVIYIPTMDWIAKAMEVLGSPFGDIPVVGLYMSPKHHRKATGLGPAGRQDWLYDIFFKRLLHIPTLRKLLVIDEMFYEFALKRYGEAALKIGFVPDFGEIHGNGSRAESREQLGISLNAHVLLVYGTLSKRKGIEQLLRTLVEQSVPKSLVVLLAGRPSAEIQAIVDSQPIKDLRDQGKIVACLSFHDLDDEYRAFMASDVVWLGYVGGSYGSSGVLYQAVCAGLPVLAMKQGIIGKLVEKYELGWTIDPEKNDEISYSLEQVCSTPHRSHLVSEKASLFLEQHSSKNHVYAVLRALHDARKVVISTNKMADP